MAGTGAAANPLALVLKAIDEPLDLIEYNQWNVLLPEGEFLTQVLLHCILLKHARVLESTERRDVICALA